MYFLLNDALLDLYDDDLSPQALGRRFAAIGFDYVRTLGCELYSEEPLLQQAQPERAAKLAALIASKQPVINAALFVAPHKGCRPEQVGVRFASLDLTAIATLRRADVSGELNAVFADRQVWRRLAA